MKYRLYRWFGITSIVVIGIIHFLLAPSEYEEAHYIGILFGANFLATVIAAIGILRANTWGWVAMVLEFVFILLVFLQPWKSIATREMPPQPGKNRISKH